MWVLKPNITLNQDIHFVSFNGSSKTDLPSGIVNDALKGEFFLFFLADKTKYLIFSEIERRDLPQVSIMLNDKFISNTDCIKFLGVYIKSDLKWNKYCEIKARKIAQAVSAMVRLKKILPSSALLTIYRSLIESYLNYSNLTWW